MKIESYALSNNEVLSASEMFVCDERQKYGRFLDTIEDKNEIRKYHVYAGDISLTPDWLLKQEEEFYCKFGNEWTICILYTPTEVCGLIAFTDWA